MGAFDVLGDPVRRRILELLADGELTAGEGSASIQHEFGISQPGVSAHLRVLRESGFTTVRPQGARRLYAVSAERQTRTHSSSNRAVPASIRHGELCATVLTEPPNPGLNRLFTTSCTATDRLAVRALRATA